MSDNPSGIPPSPYNQTQPLFFKGRGTASTIRKRFTDSTIEREASEYSCTAPKTQVRQVQAKTIISRNKSPDVPYQLSINPYQGCEHGCIYCFARPSHAYLDLSPGLDFETKIVAKMNAAELLTQELSHPKYHCQPIAVGINTDAYQPIEKTLSITRQILEVALAFKQPISIITKSSLILRDLDLLSELAQQGLFHAAISITTLDNDLKRNLEPRTASGQTRLNLVKTLAEAGIPVTVLAAPMIPFINDSELEHIIFAAADAGAESAHYMMLRLPHELSELFSEWLHLHYPDRATHVLNRIRDLRGGQLNDSKFGRRMTGEGVFADLMRQRYRIAVKKAGLNKERHVSLNTQHFCPPPKTGDQFSLF